MRRRLLVVMLPLALAAGLVPAASGFPVGSVATVYRDDFGVPHIVGQTREAMAHAAGYTMATDRLFEMDVIRRLGQGRLSEVLGAGGDSDGDGVGDMLQADMVMRREFYDREDVARQTAALPEEIRRLLAAFSDGVNRAIAEQTANPAELSVLFPALGYLPEPWVPEDSTTVLLLFTMVSFAGEGAGGELENARLLQELRAAHGSADALAVWKDLLLQNDPQAEAVIDHGDGPAAPPVPLTASEPNPAQIELALDPALGPVADREAQVDQVVKSVLSTLPRPKIGSYMVAATGERTASGKGLLLGAPQAGFLAPSVFYEFGLHAPGVDCTGFTVPGLGPFIGIGWCNDHAWSLVAGNAGDQVDVFVETVRQEDGRWQYLHRGEWRDMEVRTETYLPKTTLAAVDAATSLPGLLEGAVDDLLAGDPQAALDRVLSRADQPPADVVTQEILSTVHGPVFHLDPDRGVAYTRSRAQAGAFADTFRGTYALTFAHGLEEVLAGAERITATYNFLYADRAGNIAYRFTGWQPVRADGFDLRLPMPGTGEAEWQARSLPFDQMPNVVNPARGMLNVNQGVDSKPIDWWPRSSDIFIGRFGHTASDKSLFEGVDGLTIEGLESFDRRLISDQDLLTAQLAGLVDGALAGVDPASDLAAAKALFDDWRSAGYPRVDADRDGRLDHPAVAIFTADRLNFQASPLWGRFIDALWRPKAGRGLPGPYIGRIGMTLAAVESPELYSRPYGDGWEEAFRAALSATLDELEARFGGAPMSSWTAPAPRTSFSEVGLLKPPPMKVVDHGTYSQVVDLGSDRGVNVLPPGNGRADRLTDVLANAADGSLPPHFADQIALYEAFAHKRMLMRPGDFTATDSVEVVPYTG